MPINWQDKAVADRILAAIIASYDGKVNCTEVARLYGEDATYNAIEGFLRKPKKQAIQLKEEAAGRQSPACSPARPRAKKGDVSPKKSPVKTGRITKKKAPAAKVKMESPIDDRMLSDNDIDSGNGGDASNTGGDAASTEEAEFYV